MAICELLLILLLTTASFAYMSLHGAAKDSLLDGPLVWYSISRILIGENMKHKNLLGIYLSLTAMVFLTACYSSPRPEIKPETKSTLERSPVGPLSQKETHTTQAKGIVKKINYDTREVELQRADGAVMKIVASPNVTRLNELKVGDTVVASYYQSLAIEVRKPTVAELTSLPTTSLTVHKQRDDLPPGAGAAVVTETIVTVLNINRGAETVSVLYPNGKNVIVKVRYPENLARIKPGDKVALTYSEAMAISIDPA
jgi:hypothetical protein